MTTPDFQAFLDRHSLNLSSASILLGPKRDTLRDYMNTGNFPLVVRWAIAAVDAKLKPVE